MRVCFSQQERCNLTESAKCENPGNPSFDNTDGFVEATINGDDVLRRRLGKNIHVSIDTACSSCLTSGQGTKKKYV